MSEQHNRQYDHATANQVQTATATSPRRSSLAIVTWGAVALLAILLVMAASNIGPFAVAQRADDSKAAAPQLKSQYTAQQIANAKKHESYPTFYNAQLIVVGKVGKVQAPVPAFPGAENRPPQFDWILYPTQTLYINKQFANKYDSYLGGRVPDAELNKTPYLLARGFGEQQTYFGRADKDILQVAAIAIEQRTHADALRLHLAKTNPANTPLFKAIRAGKNVATVDVMDELAGSVSIDRAGNVEQLGKRIDNDTHIVLLSANLRGKLPEDANVGSHLRITKPLPKPVSSQPLLVVWEKNKGRAQATFVATMDEATLRIAAAAMKRNYKRFAFDAIGPQEGSSRGSDGPGGPDHHGNEAHEHEHHDGDPEADTPTADNPGVEDSE